MTDNQCSGYGSRRCFWLAIMHMLLSVSPVFSISSVSPGCNFTALNSLSLDGMPGVMQVKDEKFYTVTQYAAGEYPNGPFLRNSAAIIQLPLDSTSMNSSVLLNFTADMLPYANVIEADDGVLYGTAFPWNGQAGVVYRLDTDGSHYTILHAFSVAGKECRPPNSALLQSNDSMLYGTCSYSAIILPTGQDWQNEGCGTIFRIGTDGQNFSVLHVFNYSDGCHPMTSLMQASNSMMYGTAALGGSGEYTDILNGLGVIYRIDGNGQYNVLRSFEYNLNQTEFLRTAPLIQVGDYLYSVSIQLNYTTSVGIWTLFQMTMDGAEFNHIYSRIINLTDEDLGILLLARPTFPLVYSPHDEMFYLITPEGYLARVSAAGQNFQLMSMSPNADFEWPLDPLRSLASAGSLILAHDGSFVASGYYTAYHYICPIANSNSAIVANASSAWIALLCVLLLTMLLMLQ